MLKADSEGTNDVQEKDLVRVVNTILEKKAALQKTTQKDSDGNAQEISINAVKNELSLIAKILGSQPERQLPLDDDIRKVMEIIAISADTAIIPSIDYKENSISYPRFELLGNADGIIRILDKLALPPFNFLKREVYEKFPVCPIHPEFLGVSLRSYCPHCFSLDTNKLHLVEHMICGYISEHDLPAIPTGSRCVYCKKNIVESEIRKIGRWYRCNTCGKKFDNHEIRLHCTKFDHDFEMDESKMMVIPSYKITIDSKSLYNYTLTLLEYLNDLLEPNSGRRTQ
jgi:hypothetical protein